MLAVGFEGTGRFKTDASLSPGVTVDDTSIAEREVAYLGPPGTYSEEAARACFGDAMRTRPCRSIDETFEAVAAGLVTHTVVPIENSTEGPVTRTLDLLFDTPASIVGETVLPVRHCLLCSDTASDGPNAHATFDTLECVLAHPQALAQCRAWLDAHAPRARRVEVSSNAEAARRAAGSAHHAAIASDAAARRYGLRIAAEAIQDVPSNCTRFIVLGHHTPEPTGFDRTSVAVQLEHRPGALARLLAPLERHGVSVLWMEARPQRETPWSYRFIVDLDGHCAQPAMAASLGAMRQAGESLRVLGSYPRARAGASIPAGVARCA